MNKLAILLLIIFSLSACEGFFSATKEVELGEYENLPTVIGRLVNTDQDSLLAGLEASNFGFLISRSRSVLDNSEFSIEENATVSISGSNGTDISYFLHESGFYYPENVGTQEIKKLTVDENTSYTVTVDIPGEDLITATCEIKELGEVKQINIIQNDFAGDEFSSLDRIQIEIDDPSGENYYFLQVYYKIEAHVPANLISYNSIFDDNPALFTDDLIDGKTGTVEFWSERIKNNVDKFGEEILPNSVEVVVWYISKEEYEFRRSLQANNNAQDNPFAEPSIVFSNIENGIGIFSIAKRETFSIPWQE